MYAPAIAKCLQENLSTSDLQSVSNKQMSNAHGGIGFCKEEAKTFAQLLSRLFIIHVKTGAGQKTPGGPLLERPRKLSGPVSHPVSPRKLYGCFSKLPLFSIPLIFPVTCPVIYGSSLPPVKLPGSRKCCETKQNGGRRWTFFFSAKTTVLSKTPLFLSISLTVRSLNDFVSLEQE